MKDEMIISRFNEKQYIVTSDHKIKKDLPVLSSELYLFILLKDKQLTNEKSIKKHNLGELARIISKK